MLRFKTLSKHFFLFAFSTIRTCRITNMKASDPEWEKLSEGPWTKRRKHQVVVWHGKILLMGGFDGESAFDLNDVWSWEENISDDHPSSASENQNQNWRLICKSAGWSGRDGHCAVVLRDAIFVLGGTDDPFLCKWDVWKSVDGGVSWTCLLDASPWPERWQHAACVHTHKNVQFCKKRI